MLTLLPTPIGNLADITLRALQALGEANVVMCEDIRVTKKLIALFGKNPIIAEHFSAIFEKKDFVSFHSHNEKDFFKNLTQDFFHQNNVVYMSDAGMPCVSDPGISLIAYAIANNIPYDVLPGASAGVVAYASCGFDAQGFLFAGFLPHKQKERRERILNLLQGCAYLEQSIPIVMYESPHRILDTLEDLALLTPNARLFAIKEMTKMHQKYFIGQAREVCAQIESLNTSGEWVLVLFSDTKMERSLSSAQILQLDIPPKIKAKILSKLQNEDTKSLYKKISMQVSV
ncbi:16S rRNA (cytidine(1402)-2'-O)-methyltransferase [Helicobacter sp. 11S02596-1]|uniref:16S rRNA (cytidine(1402)-2'-O)-methyltransferase n=1 Tax=Helicobacter sp. 11S02596-1 TaxID=1476194 RepID=UPI000BA66DE4|nr:16S rRNA (cytidine(1402)-2'-O)-methyltransferase [Helicobacter sp. 11S02596-1]PAF45045.1 16S rRNA (cytidine(1402)-2'-O)-methyltransferase [Helicobacter sp. 11S02596-1]